MKIKSEGTYTVSEKTRKQTIYYKSRNYIKNFQY